MYFQLKKKLFSQNLKRDRDNQRFPLRMEEVKFACSFQISKQKPAGYKFWEGAAPEPTKKVSINCNFTYYLKNLGKVLSNYCDILFHFKRILSYCPTTIPLDFTKKECTRAMFQYVDWHLKRSISFPLTDQLRLSNKK